MGHEEGVAAAAAAGKEEIKLRGFGLLDSDEILHTHTPPPPPLDAVLVYFFLCGRLVICGRLHPPPPPGPVPPPPFLGQAVLSSRWHSRIALLPPHRAAPRRRAGGLRGRPAGGFGGGELGLGGACPQAANSIYVPQE